MRLVTFPFPVTLTIDILAWLAIHLSVSWVFTKARPSRFDPRHFLFRPRGWEREGRFYAFFFIRRWKKLIPDASAWFQGGFPKANLASRDRDYLARFIRETCRGEGAHWAQLACAPLFFLWNTAWVGALMVFYGIASNLPCILTQRHNRLRLATLLPPPPGDVPGGRPKRSG